MMGLLSVQKDIYNPWSITCFLKEKLLKPYWVHSSSNALISKLLQISNPETKMILEDILNGGCLKTEIDEEIIFDQLEKNEVQSGACCLPAVI